MSRLIMLGAAIALSCGLTGCAGEPVASGRGDTVVAANDSPEFTTGSYIARKKNKGAVKSPPPEQTEEVQRNSPVPAQ